MTGTVDESSNLYGVRQNRLWTYSKLQYHEKACRGSESKKTSRQAAVAGLLDVLIGRRSSRRDKIYLFEMSHHGPSKNLNISQGLDSRCYSVGTLGKVVPRFLPEADMHSGGLVFLPARSFTFQRRQQLVLVHPHSSDWGRYTLLHTYLRAASSHFYNSNCSTRVATHTTHGPWTTIAAAAATVHREVPVHRLRGRSSRGARSSTKRCPFERCPFIKRCQLGTGKKMKTTPRLHRHPPIRGGAARIHAGTTRAACDAEPADCDDDVLSRLRS